MADEILWLALIHAGAALYEVAPPRESGVGDGHGPETGMRVLLVEDNERLSSLMRGGLARGGFTVDAFDRLSDAEAAIDTVDYDLILLDLGLPDGDGMEWLKRFRRRSHAVPVLVVTARGGVTDRVAGLDTGADDYLVKPFEMDELLARCRAILRRPGASPLHHCADGWQRDSEYTLASGRGRLAARSMRRAGNRPAGDSASPLGSGRPTRGAGGTALRLLTK